MFWKTNGFHEFIYVAVTEYKRGSDLRSGVDKHQWELRLADGSSRTVDLETKESDLLGKRFQEGGLMVGKD